MLIDKLKNEMSKGVDPLIRVIRTVYRSAESQANVTLDELKKERDFIERIAHIAFAHERVHLDRINIRGVEAELIRPYYGSPKKKVILYCHGGGYTCGKLEYAGILGTKLNAYTGLSVLTFAYRLAPENKYPSALEDAITVWDYMMSKGLKPSQIIIVGDSAGGNLALELCLHLKKTGQNMCDALILFSPWTDMTATSPTYESEAENDPIVSRTYVHNARTAYLGEDVADFENPDYSPLFADLSGLPPTLIQVGRNEVLRADSSHLAAKMRKAGVDVKLQIYKSGWHVFQQFPTELSRKALSEVRDYLKELGKKEQHSGEKGNV